MSKEHWFVAAVAGGMNMVDEDHCLRCGESLDMTFPDLAEICADCWLEEDNLDE